MRQMSLFLALFPLFGTMAQAKPTQRPARTPEIVAPGPNGILDRPLARNGVEGTIKIKKMGQSLFIAELIIPGSKASNATTVCNVAMPGLPLTLRPVSNPAGLVRYQADFKGCPFTLDVLNGAALVSAETCEIQASTCRIDPTGLWGPSATKIDANETFKRERDRERAEAAARSMFSKLLHVIKDPARVREIARDQANFPERRAQICADYDGEQQTGFCSTRISEARAFALSSEFAKAEAEFEATEKEKTAKRAAAAARKKTAQQKKQAAKRSH